MNRKTGASSTSGVASPGTGLSLALLLIAVGAITLPFIFKAFHMDDTIFVWLGQQKLDDPLALGLPNHGYEGNFFSLYLDTHPPLFTSFVSVLLMISGGASEAGLHAGFIIFPALAAVSMFFLSRRFTDSPLVAALLLVVTPGFMVMSQSVMTDVPTLSLWLAAIAAYVYAVDRDDRRLLILSAVATSLAVLITYQSLSLLPLLFLYALLRHRVNARNMAPLAAALLVFLGIVLFYFAQTGGPPKLSYSIGLNLAPAFIANKILAILSVIGGAIVFPVFLAVGLLKGKKEYLYFAALLAAVFLFLAPRIAYGQYTLLTAVLQVIFYSVGVLAVYRFFNAGADAAFSRQRSVSEGDDIFLILWISGVLVYSIILLPYASTRYLLPLFPPVILMFVRYARTVFPGGRQWLRFAVAAIACTAVIGLAVSIADYQLAGVYRDFGSTWMPRLQSEGHKVWFAGEFGLRYYLEADGGVYLTADDNSPVPGDYVIVSHNLIASFLSDELRGRLQLVESVQYPGVWPFRVSDPDSQAGFYDQFHGFLPWSISTGPIETIDIYTIPVSGSSPSIP